MTGQLGNCQAVLEIGFHLLADETTLNAEYRNRRIFRDSADPQQQVVAVHSLAFDTVDWQTLTSSTRQVFPEESDNISRLSGALNYLSMYEFGVSEMMSLINLRQALLFPTENKVLTYKPQLFLTNVTGRAEPASWSAATLNRTFWA